MELSCLYNHKPLSNSHLLHYIFFFMMLTLTTEKQERKDAEFYLIVFHILKARSRDLWLRGSKDEGDAWHEHWSSHRYCDLLWPVWGLCCSYICKYSFHLSIHCFMWMLSCNFVHVVLLCLWYSSLQLLITVMRL